MSPIPQSKKMFRTESTDRRHTSPDRGPYKTSTFKLGVAKEYGTADSSGCFESLHELCNIQIEELKKSLR